MCDSVSFVETLSGSSSIFGNIPPSADADFCPVKHMQIYLSLRGSAPGQLFVFPGGSSVARSFFTENLNRSLIWSGFSPKIYKGHSFRNIRIPMLKLP